MVITDEDAKTILVSLIVPGTSEEPIEDIVGRGMTLMRTAFHACNGGTPQWPTPREALLGVSVSPAEVLVPA